MLKEISSCNDWVETTSLVEIIRKGQDSQRIDSSNASVQNRAMFKHKR